MSENEKQVAQRRGFLKTLGLAGGAAVLQRRRKPQPRCALMPCRRVRRVRKARRIA